MERSREGRRNSMPPNGLSRRRQHRTSHTFRDSPEEDGAMEVQEPTRLRDRGIAKKDRDHRDRDRDRDRDRERDRDRLCRNNNNNKRRRGDRLMSSANNNNNNNNNNRDDVAEDSSDESVNDDVDDEDDDVAASGGGSVRMLPLNPSSLSNHHHHQHHRKSFPPAKDFRGASSTWKAADEMIGVMVPRKARSASTKRLHECWASNGGIVGDQFHRQASTSPNRTSAVGPSPSPASPSSSSAPVRKKIKPSGPKLRPPKSSSSAKSASVAASVAAQDEIEIEIAEVLYGMMRQPQPQPQPQGIPKQEQPPPNDFLKFDSRDTNKSSRVSSPISNSQSTPPPISSSSLLQQSSSATITILSTVAAPKRKRPRPTKDDGDNPTNFTARNGPIASTTKAESVQTSKIETCSPNLDKAVGSVSENGVLSCSQVVQPPAEPQAEAIKLERNVSSDCKPVSEVSERDVRLSKEEPQPLKKESIVHNIDDHSLDVKASKAAPMISESVSRREEKIQIDLMAPPPPSRSSPERDVQINSQPLAAESEMEVKPMVKVDEKSQKMNKDEAATEDANQPKPATVQKERSNDVRMELEKSDRDRDRDSGGGNMVGKRHQPQQSNSDKPIQSSSVPLPISVPGWSGGLPPMGYMTPLQGVVSMDGTPVSSPAIPPPHPLFNQPRPKRCATHCYIARTISYHQQIARMNPFWPAAAAAGSASLYGAKACNLGMVPSSELQGNIVSRTANSAQEKGHSVAIFPGHLGKEKGSQATNIDNAQRKQQILLQPALPPGAPNNLLHAPAFIFPLNQQQAAAAAAASVRPGSVKSLPSTGTVASSASASGAVSASAPATGPASAPTMSFSYPNMPTANETQYLAILQNNGYPFPIPAHVGGPPGYRGAHAQAMPFFNGSFYSSQMLHPSQLQQQQLPAQSQQNQHVHQNANMAGGASSTQKHLHNQQQKSNANGGTSGGGGLQGFPASSKTQPSHSLQQQQQPQQHQKRQHLPNHHASHPEMGSEDSPSTADSRLTRAPMNIYGHNFAMPMQPPNFAVMTPASIGGAAGSNGNHSEKKQQQHTVPKSGAEASQPFAISFASINGAATATGLDLSSITQNHPMMQGQNFQIMAAQAAQQKKNYRGTEVGKTGCDSPNPDEDRKSMAGKAPATVGQSIVFSRPEVSDPSISTITGNTVIDSSARTLNLGSASSRASVSGMPATFNNNTVSSQQQQQMQQRNQQQPQSIQVQKHHQLGTAAPRSKTPPSSNGNVFSDHLPSAPSNKFTSSVSTYPQNLAQSSCTASQSPQWKNSVRPIASQSSPSMSSTPSSAKTVPQQQARSQQGHAQISFATNLKPSTATQGQPSGSSHSPSPPIMAGSPTTSSISKSGGSPRTTSTSTGNKVGQASLSTQQPKSSQAMPNQKSSPVGGRSVPSILSGSQLNPSSGPGAKSQLPQQQQQQQLSKQTLQQAQLFFSNAYMNPPAAQSSSSTSTTLPASAYYLQRRGPDSHMQPQSSSGTSSNGILSFCPAVTIVNTSSIDSSKIAAAAASNLKGAGLSTQVFMHPPHFAAAQQSGNHHQFVAGFPYTAPTAVQVKPAEQKQPAGE